MTALPPKTPRRSSRVLRGVARAPRRHSGFRDAFLAHSTPPTPCPSSSNLPRFIKVYMGGKLIKLSDRETQTRIYDSERDAGKDITIRYRGSLCVEVVDADGKVLYKK